MNALTAQEEEYNDWLRAGSEASGAALAARAEHYSALGAVITAARPGEDPGRELTDRLEAARTALFKAERVWETTLAPGCACGKCEPACDKRPYFPCCGACVNEGRGADEGWPERHLRILAEAGGVRGVTA